MVIVVVYDVICEPAFDILMEKGILRQTLYQIDQGQTQILIMLEQVLI